MDTETNEVDRIALATRDAIEAVETLSTGWHQLGHDELDTEALDDLEPSARQAYHDHVTDAGYGSPAELEDHHGSILGAWLDDALELYADVRYSAVSGGAQPAPRSVGVLLTCGGPDTRVTFQEEGRFAVSVQWGSDRVERFGYAPDLARYLWDLAQDIGLLGDHV